LAEQVPLLSGYAPVATTSGAFDTLSAAHNYPAGVFYPLQSFSGKQPADFSTVPLFIEGSDAGMTNMLMAIARRLSSIAIELPAQKRLELHLAAVFINNFTTHMIDIGQQLLSDNELNPEWLQPILLSTVKKLEEIPAFEAQTGPARRHDDNTMIKHIAALDPQRAELYRLISESIQQRYPRT
jgi:predicted short-subunit dehydrogenase-like oxidoreductase (DUF2520 family)